MAEHNLSKAEESFLRAWVWECAHLERQGMAHRLAEENGIQGKEIVHIVESSFPLLRVDNEAFADEEPSFDHWPWSGLSLQQICDNLKSRGRGRLVETRATPDAT